MSLSIVSSDMIFGTMTSMNGAQLCQDTAEVLNGKDSPQRGLLTSDSCLSGLSCLRESEGGGYSWPSACPLCTSSGIVCQHRTRQCEWPKKEMRHVPCSRGAYDLELGNSPPARVHTPEFSRRQRPFATQPEAPHSPQVFQSLRLHSLHWIVIYDVGWA